MKIKCDKKGFTLIEILIVVAIIAVLAALAFVALNPLERFQDAHNAQRWTDVNAVMGAIKLHQLDNNGSYLSDISDLTAGLYYQIGTGDACNDTCSNPTVVLQTDCLDLDGLVDAGYLPSVPIDPSDTNAGADETRYYFTKASTGIITVGACSETLGSDSAIEAISVSR